MCTSNSTNLPPEGNVNRTASSSSSQAPTLSSSITPARNQKLSRKRTKTGCLTCRKRRIKCGEERPICNNCIKSKRHCEGYNQKVVFKPSTTEWRPSQPQEAVSTVAYQNNMMATHSPYHISRARMMSRNPSLAPLRPRPIQLDIMGSGFEGISPISPYSPAVSQPGLSYHDPLTPHTPLTAPLPVTTDLQSQYGTTSLYGISPSTSAQYMSAQTRTMSATNHRSSQQITNLQEQMLQLTEVPLTAHSYSEALDTPVTADSFMSFPIEYQNPFSNASSKSAYLSETPVSLADEALFHAYESQISPIYQPEPPFMAREDSGIATRQGSAAGQQTLISPLTRDERPAPKKTRRSVHTESRFAPYHFPPSASLPAAATLVEQNRDLSSYTPQAGLGHSINNATQFLNAAAVEVEDDDYFDVNSEDDMEANRMLTSAETVEAPRLVDSSSKSWESSTDVDLRSTVASGLHGNMDFYRPEKVASPLKNPHTAQVFAHFIRMTGPSLSIFERNPGTTSGHSMFLDEEMPVMTQNLWTKTLPMLATQHHGLLHATLALASLQIAKLNGASDTPSLKHYIYALKHVHNCVGHPQKRLETATIAASLLLGYYELMTADHLKWNSHLLGAKLLIIEMNFAGMTKKYRDVNIKNKKQPSSNWTMDVPDTNFDGIDHATGSETELRENISTLSLNSRNVDEKLIADISGREVDYDRPKSPVGKDTNTPYSSHSDFETLQDLFWWYCKQDMYQSVVSGNPLLMDYSRWLDCPPRCPIGRAEATYGTFDHLILLLGRIAEFASRDRKRKLQAVQAAGGVWKPRGSVSNPSLADQQRRMSKQPVSDNPKLRSNMGMESGSSYPVSDATTSASASFAQIPFYGMAPAGQMRAPSSYNLGRKQSTPSTTSSSDATQYDLEAAAAAALQEWSQICKALHVFASSLGPAFQPLTEEFQPPIPSPFGAALQYRNYNIGIIWAMYYMAQIINIRSHPSMPPAAMMAVGVAAAETAPMANLIGRIAAGIIPVFSVNDQQTNTKDDNNTKDINNNYNHTKFNNDGKVMSLSGAVSGALLDTTMPLFFAGVQYANPLQRAWLISRIRYVETKTGWASIGVIAIGCETAWVKAAAARRGPHYVRLLRDETHQDDRVSGKSQLNVDQPPTDASDRRLVHRNAATRVHWAIGIIGQEDDVQ